jgi:hypothetical protein
MNNFDLVALLTEEPLVALVVLLILALAFVMRQWLKSQKRALLFARHVQRMPSDLIGETMEEELMQFERRDPNSRPQRPYHERRKSDER